MIDIIHVIDDIVEKQVQDEIEQMMFAPAPMWSLLQDVAASSSLAEKKTPGIGLTLYHNSVVSVSPFHQEILQKTLPITIASCKHLNLNEVMLHQARSFIHFPLSDHVRKQHDTIHTDILQEHLVCLYYVNDSDGDTVLFNETTEDYPLVDTTCVFDDRKFTEMKRVQPKKGRVVLFNGKRYHCSSPPQKDLRCIINFNLLASSTVGSCA